MKHFAKFRHLVRETSTKQSVRPGKALGPGPSSLGLKGAMSWRGQQISWGWGVQQRSSYWMFYCAIWIMSSMLRKMQDDNQWPFFISNASSQIRIAYQLDFYYNTMKRIEVVKVCIWMERSKLCIERQMLHKTHPFLLKGGKYNSIFWSVHRLIL